jgi:hypothetical protein
LKLYNRQWKAISELIQTRTVVQIRTHAQKYFQKLMKCKGDDRGEEFVSQDDQAIKKIVSFAYLLYY